MPAPPKPRSSRFAAPRCRDSRRRRRWCSDRSRKPRRAKFKSSCCAIKSIRPRRFRLDELMKRSWITLLCALPVLTVAAAAEDLIEPGQWKITTNTLMNGSAMPPQVKARCLTPEQAGDVGKTFGAAIDTVNSTCERTEYEASGRTLKWRLLCKGQLDMDVS